MQLMAAVGLLTWIGGFIIGLPQAFFLGVIAGFMELIPNVGPVLAAVPAVLVALLFGSTHMALSHLSFALVVIVFYTLVQMIENQFLVPKIMGGAVDLPPLIVLIGVIVAADAFGIMGALLATPMIATGKLVFRYIYGKIMEDALPVQSNGLKTSK
jgi:predicted PurR-regulated permease PerM